MSPGVNAMKAADVSKTDVRAETKVPAKAEPRITPKASVRAEATVAGIAETKIKRRRVAITRIIVIA